MMKSRMEKGGKANKLRGIVTKTMEDNSCEDNIYGYGFVAVMIVAILVAVMVMVMVMVYVYTVYSLKSWLNC